MFFDTIREYFDAIVIEEEEEKVDANDENCGTPTLFNIEKNISYLYIQSFVDDAARQFDQLTDGSGCSLTDHSDDEKPNNQPNRKCFHSINE